MKKKYKPKLGDNISFTYNNKTYTGLIDFINPKFVVCSPNTVPFTDSYGELMECDIVVENLDIIGVVKE